MLVISAERRSYLSLLSERGGAPFRRAPANAGAGAFAARRLSPAAVAWRRRLASLRRRAAAAKAPGYRRPTPRHRRRSGAAAHSAASRCRQRQGRFRQRPNKYLIYRPVIIDMINIAIVIPLYNVGWRMFLAGKLLLNPKLC